MRPALARTIVFATSASVLVIEILAARLLAPYLGVSLEVFTGIIGVVLAGISLGAWLGGRAADRGDPTAMPGPLLVVGGIAALAAPLIVSALGPALSTGPASILLASTAAFLAPAALLSAVPPVIVKIQLRSLDETGRVVGSYSAIGTAGAIVGTFATGFVLIASFPTRPIVVVLGGLLTVCGAVLWSTRRSWSLLSVAVGALLATALLGVEGPCQYETTYHCAIVVPDGARPEGRTLILDRIRNSYVDLSDPTYLQFRYTKLIADVVNVELPDGAIDVVSIGGGGFTMPGYIEATRPGTTNTVLEIDARLVDIGHTELALSGSVDVIVDDARVSLQRLADGSADVVIGDAYSGSSVPWHLTTVEFSRQIEDKLTASGIYVMNVIDYDDLQFVRSETRTLREVFPYVALFAPTDYVAGEAGGNFILVASAEPIDVAGIERRVGLRGGSEVGVTGTDLGRFIDGADVLRDDFAPVDQMLGRP